MNLPRFGVRRPVSTLMLFLGIFLIGVVSYFHLPLDMMPEITLPSISVITTYPGASPEDVEERVSKIIENAVSTVPNIEKVSSLSQESLSVVRLKFAWGTNLGDAANDIRDKLDFVRKELPDGAEEPVVFKFDISEMPILMVTARAEENYSRLYKLVDKKVVEPLERVPGVGTVWIQGGLKREIKVWVDKDKLTAYNLTVEDVADSLQRENVTLPAGNLKTGLNDYIIRIPGEFKKVKDINNIVVSIRNGNPVYLKDIARVEDAYKEQSRRIHVEGKKGLVVIVQKQSGANTVAVSQKVRAKLREISKDLPPEVKIGVMRDTAQFIIASLRNLATTLFWGSILVSIIVILFLGNVRGSFIILITLPFSLIFSFIFLYLNNYTLNWISLSSLVIALGMVVDGAIVVLESIYRKRESGGEVKEAAEAGAGEVGMAVMASYFTTIAIFIPLIFSRGIVGIMFRQMAWVIIVVLVGSLLVALTLSPMLASRILPRVPSRRPWVKRMENRYERILNLSLSFPGRTLTVIFFFLLASFTLFPFIKKEFFPRVDQGWVQAFVRLPVGTRVEETEKVMQEIEKIAAREVPERENMFARMGQSDEGFHSAMGWEEGSNIGMLILDLVPKKERKRSSQEVANALRKKFSQVPGIEEMTFETADPLETLILGGEKPVTVKIFGYNLEKTYLAAEKVKQMLKSIGGVTDVDVSRKKGKPEIWIVVDKEKAAFSGSSTASIATQIRNLFHGKKSTKFREGGDEYDILIRMREEDRKSLKDLMESPIHLLSGKTVPLKNLARIEIRSGPSSIERESRERVIKVGGYLFKRKLSDVLADLKVQLHNFTPPPGVTVKISGAVEEQSKAFRTLFFSLILGMILVYMVMASQFESFLHPLIIMFSVPFALTGVLWMLFLTGQTFNVDSLLGTVILIGIVVNNGIILVDYTNRLLRGGTELKEAVLKAGLRRVRPVLMTSLTTIFGLLPLALMRGEGSEEWNSLGLAAIGGLSLSTLVTLILIPTLYYLAERRIQRLHNK